MVAVPKAAVVETPIVGQIVAGATASEIEALETVPTISLEEFIAAKPEGQLWELHQGVIYEMPQPVGQHEDVASFLIEQLTLAYTQRRLPYRVPKTALVRSVHKISAYLPDILVLNRECLAQEPLWEKASTVTQGATIPLVVEIVSSNWRLDYLTKAKDYEEMGIPEYWIVDYAGLGGRRFIGDDKPPTISVYHLVDGEYQVGLFRGSDRLVSRIFPELALTAEQIFGGGQGSGPPVP